MKDSVRGRSTVWTTLFAVMVVSAGAALALQVPQKGGRFDAALVEDQTVASDVSTMPAESLPSAVRGGWDSFRAAHGPEWNVSLDRRSGAPLLVEGRGIPFTVEPGATVESIAASLRPFITANRSLLMADDAELVFDKDGSGPLLEDVWQIVFNRFVGGVPVRGERYLFTIGHGRLISFGSPRWGRIDVDTVPDVTGAEARSRVASHIGLTKYDTVEDLEPPRLEILPLRAGALVPNSGYYDGPIGGGYGSALVWRFTFRVAGEFGSWVAVVDAHTGAIRSFADNTKYVRAKGGIYPISDDQLCPDGCEQLNYPMPFANITIGASNSFTNTHGVFTCSPSGATATTTLSGQYVKVVDVCGAVSQSVTCSNDLDLSGSAGIDCTVPPGSSAGNTHAARSSFYHLNRIAEHARFWLPTRAWLTTQVSDTVNINSTCNAGWDGVGVNFFKSGGGCNNTGEIASVFLHEWGHGLDQNDGGDFDSPSEAYADITSIMQTHVSCLGRGFRQAGNCSGYGDACLACSGVRESDWDKHASHTPATPSGFLQPRCPTGGGPCGREEHCEAVVSSEAMWDLATRDLPASGLSQDSSWFLADRLWYQSRLGSGGDAYNCALPNSDGCSAASWFQKIRAVDDDDGNLANGTPHAAAIFAAFDRHKIACGLASDPSNLSTNGCPVLAAPTLAVAPAPGASDLSWNLVPNATAYRVSRNDIGCQWASNRVASASGPTFVDNGLPNGFALYYTIQALTANGACDGAASNCVAVTPQPFAGTIKITPTGSFACSGATLTVEVTDANIGAPPTASLVSNTETTPEVINLTRIAPGSPTYRGTINTTNAAPVHDGVLSVVNGDTIAATYVDANDGGGGTNLSRTATARSSCPTPGYRSSQGLTAARGNALATVVNLAWDVATCSSFDHHLLYGDLATVASAAVGGSICNLGTTGNFLWAGVPSGDLWFVIVGDDDGVTEGSWGTLGNGSDRGGSVPSGACGITLRDNSAVCP